MSKRKKSIALVGCGHWGKLILRDLVSLGCDVYVVARSVQSRTNAEHGGCTGVVQTVEELPAVDGAVVATPTTVHFTTIQQLLPRAIPLFVEKPLVASRKHAEMLQPYANLLFVMDKWRYHPGILELARLVQGGVLGELQSLSCTRWGWRSRPSDVDAIWHLAPHDLSIILEILGFLPDIRCVRPEYHDGVLSGCVVLMGDQPWAEIRVSERRERHYRETRVHGSAALAVLLDSYSSAIQLFLFPKITNGDPPDVELVPITDDMPLRAELAAFVHYLDGGPMPKSNFADALTIVNALEQIHALAQSE